MFSEKSWERKMAAMKKFHSFALTLTLLLCLGLFTACRKPVPGTGFPSSETVGDNSFSSALSSFDTSSSASSREGSGADSSAPPPDLSEPDPIQDAGSGEGGTDSSAPPPDPSEPDPIQDAGSSASSAASSAGESGTDEPAPPPEPSEPEPSEPEPIRNTKLFILMYHDFVTGDGADCNDWTLPISRFREDLQWLSDHGYTAVLPSQLAAGKPLPERAVMITFDDGYESNYTLAFPVLQEFNVGAVISLIVGPIDRQDPGWLTWDMCREMSKSGLVEFGSHTYESHAGQGIKRQKGESQEEYEARIFPDIEKSISIIQSELGNEVNFFAYPHGTTDKWASGFLKEHFAVTVTTKYGSAHISDGLYDLPRCNVSIRGELAECLPS